MLGGELAFVRTSGCNSGGIHLRPVCFTTGESHPRTFYACRPLHRLNMRRPQGIAATSQNNSSAWGYSATDELPHPSWPVRTIYSAQPTQPADHSMEVDAPDYGIETRKALSFRDPSSLGSARLRQPHSPPSPDKDPPHRTIGLVEHTSDP